MKDQTITFGKHTGKKFSQVPTGYLVWLSENAYSDQLRADIRAWINEHPATERPADPAPRTLSTLNKLSWRVQKYNDPRAKTTLLAARDEDGFISVEDDEDYDGENTNLMFITTQGIVLEPLGGFSDMTVNEVRKVLDRYGLTDSPEGRSYLADATQRAEDRADREHRSVRFTTLSGGHVITLVVHSPQYIEVSFDGREWGNYVLRQLTNEERQSSFWYGAVAALVPDEDDAFQQPGARQIGLTPERAALVDQKLQEIHPEP